MLVQVLVLVPFVLRLVELVVVVVEGFVAGRRRLRPLPNVLPGR